ncbi:MAG TPA: hypothetical protein VIW03_15850 [Anaeromyxobacter sp.]
MNRSLLLPWLAITVLFGGSMTFVLLSTAQVPSVPSRPDPPVDTAPAPAAPPVPAPPSPAPSLAPPLASAPRPRTETVAAARARRSELAADPSPSPMADRVTRKTLRKALLAAPVQSLLERCVDRDAGFGGGTVRARILRGRPAVLVLEVEAVAGAVRIADVAVRDFGEASRASVTCASDVLRGLVLAGSIGPSVRARMIFPLTPRSASPPVTAAPAAAEGGGERRLLPEDRRAIQAAGIDVEELERMLQAGAAKEGR